MMLRKASAWWWSCVMEVTQVRELNEQKKIKTPFLRPHFGSISCRWFWALKAFMIGRSYTETSSAPTCSLWNRVTWNLVTLTYRRSPDMVPSFIHKQGLLTMPALRFGKTNHTMRRAIYGVQAVFSTRWSCSSHHFKLPIWINCSQKLREVLIRHWALRGHKIWATLLK